MEGSRMKFILFMLMIVILSVSVNGNCIQDCTNKCGPNNIDYECMLECLINANCLNPPRATVSALLSALSSPPSAADDVIGSGGANHDGIE